MEAVMVVIKLTILILAIVGLAYIIVEVINWFEKR